MNKKIIALAVASAATIASVAQADNTTLYGRVAMQYTYESHRNDDAQMNIGNASSRFGIKGTDDLGNGLEAFYKYENRIKEGLETNKLYVGLKGDFGSASFGTQNLPHDGIANNTDPFNSTGPSLRAINGDVFKSALNLKDIEDVDTDTSASNSLVYKTPDMSGFTASAAIVMDKTDGQDEVDMYNISAEYANNGIYAGLSYISANDNIDRVLGLGLGYESGEGAGDFNVGILVEGSEFDDVDLNTKSASNPLRDIKALYMRVGGKYNVTDMDSVYASFDMTELVVERTGDAYEANVWGAGVGYEHKLSNRTKVWAEYGYQDFDDVDITNVEDKNTVSLGLRTDF